MANDEQLLRQYARERSESAFGELVNRHLNYVYSAALRVVNGDTPLAQDVTQTVFIDLARKAGDLPRDVVLSGWLHRHTCYTAATAVRTERRRQIREHTAMEMKALDDNTRPEWEQVAPYLDESLNELNPADRDALVLRFLRQQDLRAVGEALGISEEAARKRVDRALEKLHVLLKHRGATLSVAALGTALATEAVTAAPAGLAGTVAGTALASAAAGGGITATLANLLAITKVKLGIIGAFAVAGLTTSVVVQLQAQAALRTQDESLQRQTVELARQQAENERLAGLVKTGVSRANTLDELVSLRSDVEALRKQTNSLAASLEESRRLRMRNAQQANGSRSILEKSEEETRLGIANLNYTKRWLQAFAAFAKQNRGEFPTSFDQARSFMQEEETAETNFTTGQFEIVYRGPATNITSPSLVVVLREKQPRQIYNGKWARGYGFADGHSEVSVSPDGNYDAWEKRHIVAPPPDQ